MEQKTIKYLIILALPAIFLIDACYYDVEQELYVNRGCNTENISLKDTIMPLFQIHNCNACHNDALPNGGVNLTNYQGVKAAVDNGSLLGSLKWEGDFKPMPQNAPQIPDCQIAKVEQWIADGAPNN